MLLKLNTERYIVSKDRAQNTGFFCGKSPLNFQINTTSTRQNQQQQNKQTKRESRSMLKKCRHSCRRCCRCCCCCCFHAVAVVVIFMLLFPCCRCFHVVVVFMLLLLLLLLLFLFLCLYAVHCHPPLPPSIPTLRPMLPRSLEDKGILQDEVPEILVEIPNADGEYPRRLNLKSNGVIIKVTGAGSPECNGTYVPCEPFKDVSSTNPAWRRETDTDTSVIFPLSMFALHTNPNIDCPKHSSGL